MLVRTLKPLFRTKVLAFVAIFALSAGASGSDVEDAVNLDQYQWTKRLLLAFAPTRGEPLLRELHESLVARAADVADRDLVVFEVVESGASTVSGEPLDAATAELLRERFHVPGGAFSVVLVGKDGGVKLERRDRTSLEEIFELIDSMPMRQREMRRDDP